MRIILLALLALLFLPLTAQAACKYVWIDHDFDTSTPAIQKQVCDNTFDVPAIPNPSITPLQQPQIQPIPSIGIPPIGTSNCEDVSVYEDGRWITRRLCS